MPEREEEEQSQWEPTKQNHSWKLPKPWKRYEHQDTRRSKDTKQKKSSPRYIVIKLSKVKDKERILKTMKEKCQIKYKGKPITQTAHFSAETL